MNRTNTTSLTTFTLPFPEAASFDFDVSPKSTNLNAIHITIPPLSTWRMRLHRHPSETQVSHPTPACQSVTSISGPLRIVMGPGLGGWNKTGRAGLSKTFEPGLWVAWYRPRHDAQTPLTVLLVADHILWRNICSATLDKAIFPKLSSTPFWLRSLFALLAFAPSWRERLLDLMLWAQLQTIFFEHDFHLYHGFIPVAMPWVASQPFGGRAPDWAKRLQLRSLYFISRVVMTSTYWVGRLFFGMKGEYEE